MGFAGQVFAARVAIGLAIPSPQALSQAGSVLVQGASRIYGALAIEQKRRQMESEGRLAKGLVSLRGIVTNQSAALNSMMEGAVEHTMKRLDQTTQGALSGMFKAPKGAAKAPLADFAKAVEVDMPGIDIFGGGIEDGVNSLIAMGKKIGHLQEEERQGLKKLTDDRLKGAALEKSIADGKLANYREVHRGQEVQAGMLLDEEKALVKVAEAAADRVNVMKAERDQIHAIVDGVEEWGDELADTTVKGMHWTETMTQGANAMREGFNNALRNSIALLVAFGYKLNQSTQDLVEFERELLNANSVFNLTNDELFKVGNTIIDFGNQYGLAVQNGAQGLYQLASAGLTANEAMEVLPHTLKLSMAVQGDHNTISKLTAQTLFGFGMEMDRAAEVTDKFAYAIQKSLIEYQDLSSAVKFALPFFTSTGQSLDQLLGALQVLTNRALEAGIAGRGLRQALAEFAESAMDAEAGFRKLGVEILNDEGEMLQLTEIAAQFAAVVGEDINNTQLLVTLIDELNVRGATAFIHLVQGSDEFTAAVEATKDAGGELQQMVDIQNESLQAQIQILKTNVFSIFAMRDAAYEGTEFINGFHEAVVKLVESLRDLLIEEVDGKLQLTAFGKEIQYVAIEGVAMFGELIEESIEIIREFTQEGFFSARMLRLMILPLQVLLEVLNFIGPDMLKVIIYMKMLNSILPVATLRWMLFGDAVVASMAATKGWMARSMLMLGPIGLLLGGLYLGSKLLQDQGPRAAGGYVRPMAGGGSFGGGGSPYLVGEQGPELFVPNGGGRILNSMQTKNTRGRAVFNNANISIDSFGGLT